MDRGAWWASVHGVSESDLKSNWRAIVVCQWCSFELSCEWEAQRGYNLLAQPRDTDWIHQVQFNMKSDLTWLPNRVDPSFSGIQVRVELEWDGIYWKETLCRVIDKGGSGTCCQSLLLEALVSWADLEGLHHTEPSCPTPQEDVSQLACGGTLA